MLPEKRRKATIYFAIIYFVFVGILIYLMVFNTGLKIEEKIDDLSLQKKIFVKNESVKTITNITVSYMQGKEKIEIMDINKLKSNEIREIVYVFPEGTEKVQIIIDAPFYSTVAKEVLITKASAGLNYNIKSPAQIFKDSQFILGFQICNPTTVKKTALLEEKHETEFFKEGSITTSAEVEADACKNVDYDLTPKKTGVTTIYFKINVQGITDEQQITIQVNE